MDQATYPYTTRSKRSRYISYILSAAILCGVTFWIIDSFIHYRGAQVGRPIFAGETYRSWIDALILRVPLHVLVIRLTVIGASLVCGIITAVVEHFITIDTLNESKKAYLNLAEHIQEAIIRVNRAGHVLYANPAAYELLGLKLSNTATSEREPDRGPLNPSEQTESQTSAPRPPYTGLAKAIRPSWRTHITTVFSQGNALSGIDTFEQEEKLFIEWRFIPEFDTAGEVGTVLMTARDVTEHKLVEERMVAEREKATKMFEARTQELRIANAELARAARLKDEFLANMSHELRTPLTVILTFAEILKGGLYGPIDPRQRKPLEAIEQSGRHLLDLITDILDVSKIEAGKLDLEPDNVSVQAIANACAQLIEPQAKKKDLAFKVSIDPQIGYLRADERRLKQILVNLLSNAIKFTPGDGEIGLDITGDPVTKVVNFTVWDTGIGIAKKDMGRLFQPFVQLDSSLTRKFEGTGLGLALVRQLTEMHNGTIQVESELGEGSRFTVSLPWIEAEPDEPDTDDEEPLLPAVTSQARVLVVEDNQSAVRPVRKFLRSRGYDVIEARDGAAAIQRAMSDQPDVILMDIQMPVMDGLEATRRIRANPATAQIPVIALTALAMPGDQERCLQSGANAYISKPLRLRDLAELIETQLAPEEEKVKDLKIA